MQVTGTSANMGPGPGSVQGESMKNTRQNNLPDLCLLKHDTTSFQLNKRVMRIFKLNVTRS